MSSETRVVGLTLGDPSGIGPEVMLAAAQQVHRPTGVTLRLYASASWVPTQWRDEIVTLPEPVGTIRLGEPSPSADRAALRALERAVDDAVDGKIHALVTGPVSKSIFDGHDPRPPGQTEYIAGRLGAQRHAMMLAGDKLKVVPVTTHCALKEVSTVLTTERIVDATLAAVEDLKRWFGFTRPKVAVCGLNPHAGEGGRLGDEEARIITPAIAAITAENVCDVWGPLPADIVFHQAFHGRFDLVICMYHDQALGPLKLVHFYDGWNQTCGLSVPRTSPDHGTAWDIAGSAVADTRSAVAALSVAYRIATLRT